MISSTSHAEPFRLFTASDQAAFARLSGDRNPLHLDQVAARRTTFGRTVVHGVHIALWMLDWVSTARLPPLAYRRIAARFNRPLFVDEVAHVEVNETETGIELQCRSEGALLTQLKLSEPSSAVSASWNPGIETWRDEPVLLEIGAMEALQGTLTLPYSSQEMVAMFPAAVAVHGPARVAHLLGLTRIVGMEVPGLHSMFGGFSIDFLEGSGNRLDFSVSRINRNTSHVKLNVSSDVLTGTIDSFVRPRSAAPVYRDVVRNVAADEFRGRCSLIIGGSRGLGLVSAYLLTAGGARVAITYNVGHAEAEHAVQTIGKAGGDAIAVAMDAADPDAGFAALKSHDFRPTDVYYFATPHIFERKKALFEAAIFERFVKSYVTDFARVIEYCCAASTGNVAFFYPSSDALNQPIKELLEYCAAKAAGESFCELTTRFNPRVKILKSRLPRLPTDQTATLLKVGAADPAQVMLEISRNMGSLL